MEKNWRYFRTIVPLLKPPQPGTWEWRVLPVAFDVYQDWWKVLKRTSEVWRDLYSLDTRNRILLIGQEQISGTGHGLGTYSRVLQEEFKIPEEAIVTKEDWMANDLSRQVKLATEVHWETGARLAFISSPAHYLHIRRLCRNVGAEHHIGWGLPPLW